MIYLNAPRKDVKPCIGEAHFIIHESGVLMKTKEVSNFYFFKMEDKWEGDVISYFLIAGTAQYPVWSIKNIVKRGDAYFKAKEAWGRKAQNFLLKRNIYHLGTYSRRTGDKIPGKFMPRFTNFENCVFDDYSFDINDHKELYYTEIFCERCHAKEGEECINLNSKGKKKTPHQERIESTHQQPIENLLDKPLKIGENRTGNGVYYFYQDKLYLAGSREDLLELFSPQGTNDDAQNTRQRERIPDDTQIFVWNRDGGACVKCGSRENLAFDHIIPHSLGGSNSRRNLQLLCDSCNSKKSNKIGG